jgi:hypothetical protein
MSSRRHAFIETISLRLISDGRTEINRRSGRACGGEYGIMRHTKHEISLSCVARPDNIYDLALRAYSSRAYMHTIIDARVPFSERAHNVKLNSFLTAPLKNNVFHLIKHPQYSEPAGSSHAYIHTHCARSGGEMIYYVS